MDKKQTISNLPGARERGRPAVRLTRATLLASVCVAMVAGCVRGYYPHRASDCRALQSVQISETAGMAPGDIASLVLQRWLEAHNVVHFCSSPSTWISGFAVQERPHPYDDEPANPYITSFSVLPPIFFGGGDWEAGNGTGRVNSRWIDDKTIFFTVERQGDRFFLREEGTSPS